VTGSLFNDGEVKRFTATKFTKKYIVSSIKSGMVVDQQRAHQRVCMSNFGQHDGQSSFKSAIIIPFDLFFPQLELIEELKLSLVNTGFVLRKQIRTILLFLEFSKRQ
jgi:hypothetical protein